MNKKLLANIPIVFGLIAVISGFIGFYFEFNNGLIESFYRVFALFGGDGDAANKINESLWLQIAAIAAPLSVTFLIIHLFSRKIKVWWFLTFRAKDHFVICGLGDMGNALAKNLLNNNRLSDEGYSKLLIIETSESNLHIDNLQAKGAIVLTGDAKSESMLKQAKISKAKSVVLFTGNDITNLEIAIYISKLTKESSVYIHLDNRENYELLRSDLFKDIDIKSFSLYDSAAQTLFMEHPLGCNVDTIEKEDTQVKIALVGFDKVGESILYRILNLGHFYNQVPINVDIYDFDIEAKKREFLKSYPIEQDICKDYWSVNFKDEADFYISQTNYTQIIFCSIDSTRSFQDAMKLMKTNTSEIEKNNTQVYLFVDTHYKMSAFFNKNTEEFKNLYTFGNFHDLCTYDVIVNEELDQMAKKSDERYNQLHGYPASWDKLDSFTKDSNKMQVEHLSIKLKVVNHYLIKDEKQDTYESIKEEAKKRWFVYGSKIIWDDMKYTKQLAQYVPLDVLDRLAYIEHTRWNAFHILNGWKKLDIKQDTKEKISKDKVKKLHPCLVRWDELDKVSKNHNHDYKSDDVETVMRIGDMLERIEIKYSGFKKLKSEFDSQIKFYNK